MNRLHDIEMMTLTEFHYKHYAQEYKEVDEQQRLHLLAFLIRQAKATKNTGTPKNPKEEYVFKTFENFFDYEKAVESLEVVRKPKEDDMSEGMRKIIFGG